MLQNISPERWRKALIAESGTIGLAIRSLDESALQIILVVRDDNTLVGTVTDGDIRRGLLRDLNLDSSVLSIVNREPFIVPPGLERQIVLQLMKANKLSQIPIVDSNQRVVGLHRLNDLLCNLERPNTMVVMAGGKGVRLRPHTENCPKPLLPVAGKPMLEHILERASSDGIRHFVFAIHYLGEMIVDHFGDGSNWNVHIDYLREEVPLGTAGALSLLQKSFNEPLLVTNGDVMTDVHYGDILDFHVKHQATATMAVRSHEWQNPFGVVLTSGLSITNFEEKPVYKSHVNAGIYVIEPDMLSLLESNKHCDMPTLFSRAGQRNKSIIVYPIHEPWLDVGRPEDFEIVQSNFANKFAIDQ